MTLPLQPVTTGFDPRLRNLASRKIAANLLLQQLLYYQGFFDIVWLGFWAWFVFSNYWQGLTLKDKDVVRTVMFIFFFLAEPIRLAAGNYGNLQENVPQLLVFTILSVIPMQAVVFYLMLGSGRRTAYTKAVQVCQAVMLEMELVTGVYTVFRMYQLQKQQFYLFEYVLNNRARAAREAAAAAPQQAR